MACITKRKDKYLIRVSMGYDAEGKKLYESCTYTPKASTPKRIEKEVRDYAAEFEKRIHDGESMDAERITFEKFAKEWKSAWAETHLTKSTLQAYEADLRLHILPAIGHFKLSKITPLHLQSIFNKMHDDGKAAGTIRHVGVVASRIFDYGWRMGIIKENPCRRCEFPKEQKDDALHYFTKDQAMAFLRALEMEYPFETKGFSRKNTKTGKMEKVSGYTEQRTIPYQFQIWFRLALYGGFRRGEICAMRWTDVDFEKHTICVQRAAARVDGGHIIKAPKTKAGNRTVMLPKMIFVMLKRWKKEQMQMAIKLGTAWKGHRGKEFDENYIFIQDDGAMMDTTAPRHRFINIIENYNRLCEKEEEKLPMIRLHDLRHTSATLLIASGVPITTVSHRLGHSRASVTLDVYAHAVPEVDEKAAEMLETILPAEA